MNKDNIQELKSDNKVVCIDCGVKYLSANQKIRAAVCTFHEGECCVCGKIKSVTHIRHYNYLTKPTMNKEPVRIQRSRKSEQVSPNGLPIVYVGRPTKWGNPFRVEEMYLHEGKMLYGVKTSNADCFKILVENCRPAYESKHDAIKDAVKCFAIYWGETDASELRGKNLSCWCGETKPCHADILLKLANQKP